MPFGRQLAFGSAVRFHSSCRGIYAGQAAEQLADTGVTNPVSVMALIWLTVTLVFIALGIASYIRLKRRMDTALRLEGCEENVWQSDAVSSPFIMGFIRPKIYIPLGLDQGTLAYVLAHENYHLRRKDHLVKSLAFLLLAIHWFNPFCWLAFYLMNRDMEMSCDEKVLAEGEELSREEMKKSYSMSLLFFAADRRFPSPGPLAFGETDVKRRIKNVLSWKKPAAWLAAVTAVICIAVTVLCIANPEDSGSTWSRWRNQRTVAIIGGTEVSAERMEYAIRYNTYFAGYDPVEDGLNEVKTQIWQKNVVESFMTPQQKGRISASIEAKAEEKLKAFEEMSEKEQQEFFGPLGITYEEWKKIYLPEYDAPAEVYAGLMIAMPGSGYDAFNIASQSVEIIDEAFFDKMRREFPKAVGITDGEVSEVTAKFEQNSGTSDTRLYSRYIYRGGEKAILYVNTLMKDGSRSDGEIYAERKKGQWSFTDFKKFTDYGRRKNLTHNIIDMNQGEDGDMKSFYIDSFNFFPEFYSPNMGSVIIEKKGDRTFMSVRMIIMRYTNTGAPEGPEISFIADMTDFNNPVILRKKMTGGTYYGNDEAFKEHSEAYYVIGEERLREMAKKLYDYVPAHDIDDQQ